MRGSLIAHTVSNPEYFLEKLMNLMKFETGSFHYMHLADPSEEGIGNCEEPKITTLSNGNNPLATTLTLIASRGTITSEEYAQLAEFVIDR